MIVTVPMMMGDEQGKRKDEKTIEIKDFYTRYNRFNKIKKRSLLKFISVVVMILVSSILKSLKTVSVFL